VLDNLGFSGRASAGRAREVVQAEMALIAAREQVRALQERALLSSGYDPEAYDQAIMAYREAHAWAVIVRAAWRYWQGERRQAASEAHR
jgi:hypothetical protein